MAFRDRVAQATVDTMAICLMVLFGLMLAQGAVAQVPTPGATDELERRFKLADRDGDGTLSSAEAKQSGWFLEQSERFESMDRDKSGTVTLFEITQSVAAKLKEWAGADSDGDGRVTETEAKQRSGSIAEAFLRADTDRDHVVTRDEYERASQRSYYDNVDLPSVAPNIIEKRF